MERPRTIERLETSGGTLCLRAWPGPKGDCYEVIVGGHVAMSTADGATEQLLVETALKRTAGRNAILVGGLGLGCTLRQVLTHAEVETVWVSEIEEAVVRWNRTYLRDTNGDALDDPRVRIHLSDVLAVAASHPDSFDAVLLDVDNGPSMLLHPSNGALYRKLGLDTFRGALVPGGVLAIWCNQPEPDLEHALGRTFANQARTLMRDPAARRDAPPTVIYTAVRR